ncbi:unnamed protein product, partial [Owenia fusiformis]
EVSQQISGLVAVTKDLQVEQNNMREQVVHISKELGEIKIQTQRQATPIEQRSTAVDQTSAGEQNSIPDTATGTHDTTNVFNVPVPEKVIKTIKNGEFVQMIDILPANLLHDHHENPDPILSLENGQLRQKQTRKIKIIENFSQWLSAWNIFEAIIVQNAPHTYPGLCTYRNIIQEADAKFKWNAVNAYDVKYRSKLSQTKSQQFGNIDTQLYVTTFDSTAVKQHIIKCYRCAGDHKVSNCPFQAGTTVATSSAPSTTTTTYSKDKIKNEICNKYQHGECKYGSQCFRIHKCQGCGASDIPKYKCKKCIGGN